LRLFCGYFQIFEPFCGYFAAIFGSNLALISKNGYQLFGHKKISGHKSERVFEKYNKVGVSEQANRIYNKLKVLKGGKNKKVG
jgi:hypothetical protein